MKNKKKFKCAVCGNQHSGESKLEGVENVVSRLVQCIVFLKERIEVLEERWEYRGRE